MAAGEASVLGLAAGVLGRRPQRAVCLGKSRLGQTPAKHALSAPGARCAGGPWVHCRCRASSTQGVAARATMRLQRRCRFMSPLRAAAATARGQAGRAGVAGGPTVPSSSSPGPAQKWPRHDGTPAPLDKRGPPCLRHPLSGWGLLGRSASRCPLANVPFPPLRSAVPCERAVVVGVMWRHSAGHAWRAPLV